MVIEFPNKLLDAIHRMVIREISRESRIAGARHAQEKEKQAEVHPISMNVKQCVIKRLNLDNKGVAMSAFVVKYAQIGEGFATLSETLLICPACKRMAEPDTEQFSGAVCSSCVPG